MYDFRKFLDEAAHVRPSARQLRMMDTEFYAFAHFGPNTFTDREWGLGSEDEACFNPVDLDCDQWVEAVKSAGMKGLVLTAKHHDGFCLWPSRYTEHSVKNSPIKRDVVKECAEACARGGIKFGVYLSPWDRNSKYYGSDEYNVYYRNQLTELLTEYGPLFHVWFDGACGEGPNGKKQHYDWDRYYSVIRGLQPEACIHVCGPDVRWCGNEAGHIRASEWSVVPRRTTDTEKIASASQQADDPAFRQRPIHAWDRDLGSREILAEETDLVWYPAEVNTSIRPGWFWHASENDQIKPLDQLIDIYEKSVGGNATFLLNIPPNREGRFDAPDVQRLREFGAYLRRCYTRNLAPSAAITANAADAGHEACSMLTDDGEYYLPAAASGPVRISLRWQAPQLIHRVVLKEAIALSQRVERFHLEIPEGGCWKTVAESTVIGHKRILPMNGLRTDYLRIVIDDARVRPVLSFLAVYRDAEDQQ